MPSDSISKIASNAGRARLRYGYARRTSANSSSSSHSSAEQAATISWPNTSIGGLETSSGSKHPPQCGGQTRPPQQIIARGRKQASLGNGAAPVAGSSHALQRHRNRTRRIDLHHPIDGTDIDYKVQRGGRHQPPD